MASVTASGGATNGVMSALVVIANGQTRWTGMTCGKWISSEGGGGTSLAAAWRLLALTMPDALPVRPWRRAARGRPPGTGAGPGTLLGRAVGAVRVHGRLAVGSVAPLIGASCCPWSLSRRRPLGMARRLGKGMSSDESSGAWLFWQQRSTYVGDQLACCIQVWKRS